MKEPHREGVAIRSDPESCAAAREGGGEALTGARTGWVFRPGVSAKVSARRTAQPRWAVALADKAQHRLCRRYARLVARGKPTTKVIGAIARELVGFLWAALYLREHAAA